ncbi:DUF3618 domain-containing protein [Micromonospora olivasterospora]|uniref:Uncharacterized protein DUF3618 n=1 Tax=Micromonospora olivasterospora TaxID=1880 RepID=A0A562I2Y4_MICOL|nr:DUF3618 domain-containing protein [Micromonospora olivasterospora]TWH65360.1 uncharacterized protein DUF3618 [Micromonospora olivasterospora]
MTASDASDPGHTGADIQRTRAELADTVHALAAKTDVKARGLDSARRSKAVLGNSWSVRPRRCAARAQPCSGQHANGRTEQD